MYYAIRQVTSALAFESGNIFYNGRCIASTAFLLYYSIKAITDSFYVFDLSISTDLELKLLVVSAVSNAFCNILYVYAIVCLKQKEKFTLAYL